MKGTTEGMTVDWLEFDDPVQEGEFRQVWRVHLNFMLSNWTCLFGQGCPGNFGKQDAHTNPDLGCCTEGVYITSKENFNQIQKQVHRLTEDDIGKKGLDHIRNKGWINVFDSDKNPDSPHDEDGMNSKTKVREGGCVFANRTGENGEKIGCAFLHQASREQGKPISEIDHTEVMPEPCWQLPIGLKYTEDPEKEVDHTWLVPWDADYWGGAEEDGTHDSWLSWWCVDTPDAYVHEKALYRNYERELRKMMGDAAYEKMCDLIAERTKNFVSPMPGAVRNEGRPLIPVFVGNRTPIRPVADDQPPSVTGNDN